MTAVSQDLKKAIKEKKIVIGTRTTMKAIKAGKINEVIFASNIPSSLLNDLENFKKVGIEIKKFKEKSDKLGETCRKPFNILIVGIKK